ncbi:MAG: ATP-binding protein [Deltaproteobacteria bacterium]
MKKGKRQADWSELEKREAAIKPRSKFFSHLSVSLLTLVLTIGLHQADFDSLKGLLIDGLFRTQLDSHPHPAIKLVAYDTQSAARYQINYKIPTEELLKTITRIKDEQPLAVALIAPLNEKLYSEQELSELAHAFSQVPMYVGYTDSENMGKNAPRALFHSTHYLPGYVSRDTFSYGADSVSRRVMLTIDGLPTVYLKLAELFHHSNHQELSYPKNRIEKFGESTQSYINWQGRAGSYPMLSTLEVSEGHFPKDYFKNKIVLISSTLPSKKDADFIFTPFSREPFHTPLLEGSAHSLATLINQNGIYKSSFWADFFLSLILGLITMNLLLYLSPARSIQFLIVEILFLTVLSGIALWKYQYWVDVAHPLALLAIGYYLIIPYRLVDEYKKRWHYQEKSEFMAELEQLKTNFFSLISHDLKTPLARIQGNAELALSHSSTDKDEKQKKSLEAIIHTTDELSHYVETVLDLTRIESSKVQLNKTSKDINTVVKEVLKSKIPFAKEKDIQIQTHLEPLFSFNFDVKLIQQVIANLVENAIKYSPRGSTITINTKEVNSLVEVSIRDEGPGIPLEEHENIFSKFYRMKNDATQREKGTGLGLYLVKYFVELHNGFISLKSQVGKGSDFTITLPV